MRILGRILGIDYGKKRIGLALSDPLGIIASSLENLDAGYSLQKSAERLVKRLSELAAAGKEVTEIVLGLPIHMNGSESERSQEVRKLKSLLEEKSHLPVHLLDERLTSVQAERALKEGGFSRKKRTKFVDGVSCVILLQTYLNQQSTNGTL